MESFADPKKNIEYLHLKSDSVVADLGTGSGHYAFALGEKIKAMGGGGHGIVYAIEVQKSLLDRVKQEADRRGLGNVSVIWGDVDVLGGTKLADNICDALVVSNVLFQSESREAFLKEANRDRLGHTHLTGRSGKDRAECRLF